MSIDKRVRASEFIEVGMWSVYEYHDSVHVVPEKDLKPHTYSPDCECGCVYFTIH